MGLILFKIRVTKGGSDPSTTLSRELVNLGLMDWFESSVVPVAPV